MTIAIISITTHDLLHAGIFVVGLILGGILVVWNYEK